MTAMMVLPAMAAATTPTVMLGQFGTQGDDRSRDVEIDATSIYYVGETSGTFPDASNAGGNDVFLRKYDHSDNVVWTRQFGTAGNDVAWSVALSQGGFAIAGETTGAFAGETALGQDDAFVARLGPEGQLLWVRQFGTDENDRAYGVTADASGIYVTGQTRGAFNGVTPNGYHMFLRKYNLDGDVAWTWTTNEWTGYGNDVAAFDGAVYLAGNTDSSFLTGDHGVDWLVIRYDPDGNQDWIRKLDFTDPSIGTSVDIPWAGIQADATGVYVGGNWLGQHWRGALVRFDHDGNELWRALVEPDPAFANNAVAVSAVGIDGQGIYVMGDTSGALPGQTNPRPGVWDAWVRRYNLDGTSTWTVQMGGTGDDQTLRGTAGHGRVLLTGATNGVLPGAAKVGGSSDALGISILVNQDPDCSAAGPAIASLWPPNHKFVAVDVAGVSDPDGDSVEIVVTSVHQDEPVDGSGDGTSEPDARGLGDATVDLRAERSGSGDGRIYILSVRAEDPQGASCTALVRVAVPHAADSQAVDSGARYDSTTA